MDTTTRDDIRDFHKYLGKEIRKGRSDLTPEKAIEEWRAWVDMQECYDVDDDEAIRQVLEDIANGDKGITFEEADRQLRKEFDLPPRQ